MPSYSNATLNNNTIRVGNHNSNQVGISDISIDHVNMHKTQTNSVKDNGGITAHIHQQIGHFGEFTTSTKTQTPEQHHLQDMIMKSNTSGSESESDDDVIQISRNLSHLLTQPRIDNLKQHTNHDFKSGY